VPRLIEERQIHIEFADLDCMVPKQRIFNGPRSSGIHLSGVVKVVLLAAGLLTPDDLADEIPIRMCVGMAWEQFVVQLWPDFIWQPGECRLDGIVGSPDGMTGDVLEEIKATWIGRMEKGSRPPVPRKIIGERRWMMQLAGYCKMLNLTRARLHVLWVNGDYHNSGPEYFTYLIEFTQAELDRMWTNMILPNRSLAKAEEH
jgi:hypothetical protein